MKIRGSECGLRSAEAYQLLKECLSEFNLSYFTKMECEYIRPDY